jgi:hypothetical protein
VIKNFLEGNGSSGLTVSGLDKRRKKYMKNDKTSDRRNFLKTAGAVLVAASVPAAVPAQKADARQTQNNLKQMIIFGGIAEPNPGLPGAFGQACFQFQMQANLDGSRGFAIISDPVVSEINTHIHIRSVVRDINDMYIFRGGTGKTLSSVLLGKEVEIRVQVLDGDNCSISITIEDTPVAGLLLPAVQKIRIPIYG